MAAVGTSNPAYGVVTPSGHSTWVWAAMTGAAQALQYPAGTDRIAATWYEASFTIDVSLADGQPHQVALYGVDRDLRGRSQRIDVLDAASGAVLDTQTVSNFGTGQYWVWQVRGAVRFRVTALTGPNAVISGVFVGGDSTVGGPLASYVGTNSTTQGTWKGAYGADGWAVAAVGTSNPAYGVVTPSGHSSWVWAAMTGAAQALQYPAGTDRIAATWYEVSFTIDVSLTDGQPHQVALYGVDWDLRGRSQRIDVLDAATGAVLDTQTVSNFGTGQYWVWQVRGAVRFRVTALTGPNAVISGVFVDGASAGDGRHQ